MLSNDETDNFYWTLNKLKKSADTAKIILILLVTTFLPISDYSEAKETSIDKEVLEYFYEVALEFEFGDARNFVVKFENEIHLNIINDNHKNIEYINEFINKIEKIIDKKIHIGNQVSNGINIIFANNIEEFKYGLNAFEFSLHGTNNHIDGIEVGCFARIYAERALGIVAASIVIPTFIGDGYTKMCIQEEFIQGMGLTGEFDRSIESILSNNQEIIDATRYDFCFLSILYNPQVKTGMTKDMISPIGITSKWCSD